MTSIVMAFVPHGLYFSKCPSLVDTTGLYAPATLLSTLYVLSAAITLTDWVVEAWRGQTH